MLYPSYINIATDADDIPRNGYFWPIYANIKNVQSILELGSRDCVDAIKLSNFHRCHVFAFECNPESIKQCEIAVINNPNVTLEKYAVWHHTCDIEFYPIQMQNDVPFNIGASSCFKINEDGHHGNYTQSKLQVKAIRLDEWLAMKGFNSIDLICIDIQGAAWNAIISLDSYINNVKYFIVEVAHKEIYQGEVLYSQLNAYMEACGFTMYAGYINRFFGDYLYMRNDLIKD